ncbi:MAG: DUF1360 domain-containing protein [Bacteroidales bacterium]
MDWYLFMLCLLAAWRITYLLQAEDGPFDLVYRLRKMLGNSVFGRMMDCFNCLSIWVAMPFAYFLGETWALKILTWLAISGGAIVLERLMNRNKSGKSVIQNIEEK